MKQKTQIVFLAAGMARRYGKLKQLEEVGPSQESLIEYTLYDAWQAGFSEAIFIIRESFEAEFVSKIVKPYTHWFPIRYVFQEYDNLPTGVKPILTREKPWGTAHALWCAKDVIDSPFALVNADDFYGRTSIQTLQKWLSIADKTKIQACLVGYLLSESLSIVGSVSRGICDIKDDKVVQLTEYININRNKNGYTAVLPDRTVSWKYNPWVSLNCWGLTPELIPKFTLEVKDFFINLSQEESLEKEIFLPNIVDRIIKREKEQVYFFKTTEKWLGLTYPEDIIDTKKWLQKFIAQKLYPKTLAFVK